MITLMMAELLHCHICSADLKPHPLYSPSVARTCSKHGDFFLQEQRGYDPVVIFRAFESARRSVRTQIVRVKEKSSTRSDVKVGRPGMAVRCDQTGIIYQSQTEAAKAIGAGQSEISDHLSGRHLSVKGHTFTKMVDDGLGGLVAQPRPVLPRNQSRLPQGIVCDQTGECFESIREASRVLGIPKTTIRYRLQYKLRYRVSGEYTFSPQTSQEKHGLI